MSPGVNADPVRRIDATEESGSGRAERSKCGADKPYRRISRYVQLEASRRCGCGHELTWAEIENPFT
jgi:hypothetical protein